MLCFGVAKPQHVPLQPSMIAEKEEKKFILKVVLISVPSAWGPRALHSEPLGSVNRSTHTCKVSVDKNENGHISKTKAKIENLALKFLQSEHFLRVDIKSSAPSASQTSVNYLHYITLHYITLFKS